MQFIDARTKMRMDGPITADAGSLFVIAGENASKRSWKTWGLADHMIKALTG